MLTMHVYVVYMLYVHILHMCIYNGYVIYIYIYIYLYNKYYIHIVIIIYTHTHIYIHLLSYIEYDVGRIIVCT